MLIKVNDTFEDFLTTANSSNHEEIYDALVRLRPDRLDISTLVDLVKYIEKHYTYPINKSHYNIFGTGGDKIKTINISTIASIIASNFTTVWKVGTSAVTSKWGSSDFVERISSSDFDFLPESIRKKMFYQNQSGYLSLKSLGFLYSEYLKQARVELYQNKMQDIYKVIFPASNLTNSSGQVNGVYDDHYLDYFVRISSTLEKNCLLVHSDYGVDEIFSGKNTVIRIIDHKITQYNFLIPIDENSGFYSFIAESLDINDHILKFASILENKCSEEIILVIAYNVASILSLKHRNLQLESLAEKIFNIMRRSLWLEKLSY